MGFRSAPVDTDFARRSARYLANSGYRIDEITKALVDELDISAGAATQIVTSIAA